MSNNIVVVNVSQTVGATPSTLQQTGAFVSQGGTNTAQGTRSLLTELSDLTPLLAGSRAITSAVATALVVTATTTAPHGFTVGETIQLTIAAGAPSAFNGTFQCLITTTTQFTYTTAAATGTATGTLVYTNEDVAELLASATTFFGQGSAISVYVLELGQGNANDGVAFLTSWITANPNTFYGYFVPNAWDGNTNFLALTASFQLLSAKTYFWVETTLETYTQYTTLMKDVITMVEAPSYGIWPANAITSASWASGVITFHTTATHLISPGMTFQITGMTPATYNGTFQADITTVSGSSIINAPLVTNPGSETGLGTLVASYYASTGAPVTEQSLAAAFYTTLNYNPSSTNKVTPLAFSYQFGVTPFPRSGNAALLTALKAASVNYIDTGSEGGIVNSILKWGHTMDGRPFNYWYSIDWVQINLQLNLANEIINGSNNPINPLYLDQNGINRLQARAAQVMGTAITVGLALGTVAQSELNGPAFNAALNAGTFALTAVVNAVPFVDYYTTNPGDYKIGVYNGLSVTYIPLRGFEAVTVNVNASDFITV